MTISLKPKAPICLSHPELNELAFTFRIPVIIEKIKICTIAGKKCCTKEEVQNIREAN